MYMDIYRTGAIYLSIYIDRHSFSKGSFGMTGFGDCGEDLWELGRWNIERGAMRWERWVECEYFEMGAGFMQKERM